MLRMLLCEIVHSRIVVDAFVPGVVEVIIVCAYVFVCVNCVSAFSAEMSLLLVLRCLIDFCIVIWIS